MDVLLYSNTDHNPKVHTQRSQATALNAEKIRIRDYNMLGGEGCQKYKYKHQKSSTYFAKVESNVHICLLCDKKTKDSWGCQSHMMHHHPHLCNLKESETNCKPWVAKLTYEWTHALNAQRLQTGLQRYR